MFNSNRAQIFDLILSLCLATFIWSYIFLEQVWVDQQIWPKISLGICAFYLILVLYIRTYKYRCNYEDKNKYSLIQYWVFIILIAGIITILYETFKNHHTKLNRWILLICTTLFTLIAGYNRNDSHDDIKNTIYNIG